MKRDLANQLAAAIYGTLATFLFCNCSNAAQPPPTELARWEESLRQANASPDEISRFEEWIHVQPSAGLVGVEESVRADPHYFETYVWKIRRQEGELVPKPIFPGAAPICPYEDLRKVSIPDTTIDSVTIDPRDGSCRITATVIHPPANDRVKVFIALPVKNWNGRFRGTGGGGYAGGSMDNLRIPVARGYAVGATDTGHETAGAGFALDAEGRLNWQEIRDNSYLGIHDMTVVGKALAQAFYGKAPRYSYFLGGSTGGRQGMMEAQRYPQDYDGIVSAYPAINRDRYTPAMLWPQVVMLEARNLVSKAKLDAATAAAVAACDGADGVVDGVVGDPTLCAYDPKALVGTAVGGEIFTEADADVVRKIWEGPRGHDGKFLWYGPMRGADLSAVAGTAGSPLTGRPSGEGLDWFRYFLLQNPSWDWRTLTPGEFELLFNQSVEQYGKVIGTDEPDLSDFRNRGGKLIILHGLADQIIPAEGTVDYYKEVQRRMGGPQQTAKFARLFLVPGGNHGFSPMVPTPSAREMMDAIIRWVEDGRAPEKIITDLPDRNGHPFRTRPLFAYPHVAKYTGSGSTDDASNFVSGTPSQ